MTTTALTERSFSDKATAIAADLVRLDPPADERVYRVTMTFKAQRVGEGVQISAITVKRKPYRARRKASPVKKDGAT